MIPCPLILFENDTKKEKASSHRKQNDQYRLLLKFNMLEL